MSEEEKKASGSPVKQVGPGEVLQKGLDEQPRGHDLSAREKAEVKELDPLQKVGFKLALTFFVYILLASIAIFWVSFGCIHAPPLPAPPPMSGDPEQYKKLVDIYKQSSDIYQQIAKSQVERATQLFQLVVASSILPVFSAILGYIFGSKRST
jgi:hypothetical protein